MRPWRHSQRPTLVLAVSGHGFGHAVRCAEVARALLDRGARVLLRSEAPRWLFPSAVEPIPSPGWPLDVGVAQHDGLELDVDETRRRWDALSAQFEPRAGAEARLLREVGADLVLGDVPPLAFAAAARAGVPGVALANFGWDWIYAAWPDFGAIIRCIQSAYGQAERLLRLPLHSPTSDAFAGFGRIEDVPLVARQARLPRAAVRQALGLAEHQPVVLLSFGGFDARGIDLAALGGLGDTTFVLTPPLSQAADSSLPPNVLRLAEQPEDYVSLLAACDAVVTKPGYGIASDCLANRVPMLYTERGPFREYDVLVAALHALGPAHAIPRAELLAGNLGPYLERLLDEPTTWRPLRLDGAAVVAARLLEIASGERVSNE